MKTTDHQQPPPQQQQRTIKVKLLTDTAVVPKKATKSSAAFDLRLPNYIVLRPHEQRLVSLGIAIELPAGYYAEIHIRSSLGNRGIILGNSVGIIDNDYRGELKVILKNTSVTDKIHLKESEAVAQLLIKKDTSADFNFICVDAISTSTERGEGGFGSTNNNNDSDNNIKKETDTTNGS